MTLSLDWIEEIKQELFDLGQPPIVPQIPGLSLESVASKLSAQLGLALTLSLGDAKPVENSSLYAQMRVVAISLNAPAAPLFVAIEQSNFEQIVSWLLSGDVAAAAQVKGSLQENFVQILTTATLQSIALPSLSILSLEAKLPSEPMVTQALQISCGGKTAQITLLLTRSFRTHMEQQISAEGQRALQLSLPSSKIALAMRMALELVPLTADDLVHFTPGAFLRLERAGPAEEQTVQLMLGRRAFFAAKAKGDKLRITAVADPVEENRMTTPDPNQPPADNEKLFRGEDEEFFVEDAELAKVLEQEGHAPATATPAKAAPAAAPKPLAAAAPKPIVQPTDVPIVAEVVIGYLRVTVGDLLQMGTGATYNLSQAISNNVDIVVGGKRIAKGELVKSGDLLGVRITSL